MARRASRVDANHAEIVAALRKIGASVADTSGVGGGFPDLVVGYRGRNLIVEVKDGSKPPSKRKLTPDQVDFVAAWRGHWMQVRSVDEAIAAVSRASDSVQAAQALGGRCSCSGEASGGLAGHSALVDAAIAARRFKGAV